MDNYIPRDGVEEDLQNLIDKQADRKLACLYGVEQMGKTFTLEYVQTKMLKDALVMLLPLSSNNLSNPMFLKKAVIDLLKSSRIASKKDVNPKKHLMSIFKGVQPSLPFLKYDPSALIDSIESAMSTYEDKIIGVTNREGLYIEKLVEITTHIAKESNQMLYILVDDIHHADEQIFAFLEVLLMKDGFEKGLFITYDSNGLCDEGRARMEDILKKFINPQKVERELKEFHISSTRNFIEYAIANIELSDELVEEAHLHSSGRPGILAVLTTDLNTLEKIENNEGFAELMDKLYDRLTKEEQEVITYISLSQNEIHVKVLEALSDMKKELDLENAVDSLIRKKIIGESTCGEFYGIKFKKLVSNTSALSKNRMRKDLYQIYRNSTLKSEKEYLYFTNVINLSRDLRECEDYYKSVIDGSSYFNKSFKYERAIEHLERALFSASTEPSDHQRVEMIVQYVEALFALKRVGRIIELYESLSANVLELVKSQYPFLLISISRAYYYNNQPKKVHEILDKVESRNEVDLLQKTSTKCAAYDLSGDYDASSDLYYVFMDDKTKNAYSRHIMKIFIQMVESDFKKCISELGAAIGYFEAHPAQSLVNKRYLAAALNNKGIELLMNGEKSCALKHLMESYELFKGYLPVEEHFPLNNMGLFHLLVSKDFNEAMRLFNKASMRAISPLQKCYVGQNIASTYVLQGENERALEHIESIDELLSQCPDPVAQNYFAYNLAYIKSKNGILDREKIPYLKKPQLKKLNEKRQKLNQEQYEDKQITTRRSFFATIDFEPCELMFYR